MESNEEGSSGPSATQLRRGASGISYRAQQLTYAVLLPAVGLPDGIPKLAFDVISNSRVESILSHSRALTEFLSAKPQDRRYIHYSHFKAWSSDVQGQLGRVFGVVSMHVSHPTLADDHEDEDEAHPGEWPLTELAVTLVGGLCEFLEADGDPTPNFDIGWFDPNPLPVYGELRQSLEGLPPTEVSKNPRVAKLTAELQGYLLAKGILVAKP